MLIKRLIITKISLNTQKCMKIVFSKDLKREKYYYEMVKKARFFVCNLYFPSENIYKIIYNIDQELRKLYSIYNVLTLNLAVHYSKIRESESAAFISLLNRVEKELNKITKEVVIDHVDDLAFRGFFYGMTLFLEEGGRIKKKDSFREKVLLSCKQTLSIGYLPS